MTPQSAQRSLAFRLFRSVVIALAICLLGFVVLQLIYSDWPRFNVPSMDAAPVCFVLAIVLLVLIHLLVVLRSQRLTHNSASDLIIIIPLVVLYLIASLAVILLNLGSAVLTVFGVPGLGPTNLVSTLGALGFLFVRIILIALLVRPLLVYSIRSNWVTVIPLVISYAAVLPYILLILSNFNEKWIVAGASYFGLTPASNVLFAILCAPIMCYYVALGGVMFPTHRKLGNLWRPRPLPKLPHRPIPAQEAKL